MFVCAFVLTVAGLRAWRTAVLVRTAVVAASLWAIFTMGWAPIMTCVVIMLVATVIGLRVTRDRELALPLGIGVLIFCLSIAAHWRVNFQWTYGAAAILVLLLCWRQSLEALQWAYVSLASPRLDDRWDRVAFEFLLLPLFVLLAVVPKPEISPDALGIHMAIPAEIARTGLFSFDVHHVVWAVMPAGVDWLYSVAFLFAGEKGARLFNWCMMASLSGLVAVLARRWSTTAGSLLAAAVFVTTPVVLLVTGSLFVENTWTLLIAAGVLAIAKLRCSENGSPYLAGLLLGSAIACKSGAFAYAVPLLFFVPLHSSLQAIGTFLLFGCPPYVSALILTGNPIFPYLNGVFHSPLFMQSNFGDIRYKDGIHWRTLWDATFHSDRYLEGRPGAFGIATILFLPPLLIVLRRRWNSEARVAILIAIIGFVIAFEGQSYLRYIYPTFALLAASSAMLLDESARGRLTKFALPSAIVCVAALQLYMYPASGWSHRDFMLDPRDPAEAAAYETEGAPSRKLARELNYIAPGQSALFLDTITFSDLRARAYTDLWHHWSFVEELKKAGNAVECLRLMNSREIFWYLAPASQKLQGLQNVALERFLARFTTRVAENGVYELRRLKPQFRGEQGLTRAADLQREEEKLTPGEFDDADIRVGFSGFWQKSRVFPQAYNGTESWTDNPAAYTYIVFRGKSVTWNYATAPNRGIARIEVDGEPTREIDLYSKDVNWRSSTEIVCRQQGEHRIVIRCTGKKRRGSSGTFVDVDRFVIH